MIKQTEYMVYEHSTVTIEEQLHAFERNPEKNERNAVLWHAWQQNKRWLSQLLELTVASFPAYSRHNVSHAKAVLYNIERILGEERIKKLGPADCFAILHVVYVHDIGMVILSSDREKMVTSDEFSDMLDTLAVGADVDLRNAARNLMRRCYHEEKRSELPDYGGEEYLAEKKRLYKDKFDTYYAIIQLMAEFQRGHHGENAASKIQSWISDQDKLRSEFAMSGIPMRIFLRIAECASLHTEWDFQQVMNLPFDDDGYGRDMMHPRFIAVLLQLGDALDIDNDRFHPFAQAFLGKLPMQSQAHYDKHMSIRTLKITSEEILIEADCSTRDALRLVRKECDALERLLQLSSYHWSSIAPKDIGGALPTLQTPKLLLQGNEIPQDLAMMKFQISQSKAFSLLQGENIYSGRFPFVRELLQNAIDSTKIQCWEDYIGSSKFRYTVEKEKSILQVAKIINPVEYPIEVEIKAGKRSDKGIWTEVDYDKIPSEDGMDDEYGILFSIRDYGTGIGTQTLRDIANVGTSYKNRKKILRDIPEWLRPTGEFGIGLQSVFLVTDSFYCDTYTRHGERYRIEFRTGATGEYGYINAEPLSQEENAMPFGTVFSVFISHKKKKYKDEFLEAWHGYDPFDANYKKDTIKRELVELTSQIVIDMDNQLGEMLFPVYVHVDFDFEESYEKRLTEKLQKITLDTTKKGSLYNEKALSEKVSWIYSFSGIQKEQFQCFKMSNGLCGFDFMNMKLYIWLEDISTYARLGVKRIMVSEGAEDQLCKVYFKGIKAADMEIQKDASLLEMIDIKGGKMPNNFLQLSRSGFTEKGNEHLKNTIVPEILQGVKEALATLVREVKCKDSQNKESDSEKKFSDLAAKYFEKNIKADLESMDCRNTIWQSQLLGVSLFYHFYMMYNAIDEKQFVSKKQSDEKQEWENTLEKVNHVLEENELEILHKNKEYNGMNIRISKLEIEFQARTYRRYTDIINVAELFDQKKQYLLISERREKGGQWINHLVQLLPVSNESQGLIEKIASRVYNAKELRQNEEEIEKWGDYILDNVSKIIESCTVEQSKFLQKLLKDIPVIGKFSSPDGNICVHVLSGKSVSYIYYNQYARVLYIEKMLERYRSANAVRCLTFPYYGYEVLGLEDNYPDACDIAEQYIYDIGKRMIFPCSGTALEELHKLLKEITLGTEFLEKRDIIQKGLKISPEYLMIGTDNPSISEQKIEDILTEYRKLIGRPVGRNRLVESLAEGYAMIVRQNRIQVEVSQDKKLPENKELIQQVSKVQNLLFEEFEYTISAGQFGEFDMMRSRSSENKEQQRETGRKERKDVKQTVDENVKKLIEYDIIWKREYENSIRLAVVECCRKVKIKYWDNSPEKEEIIQKTLENSKQQRDLIEENYERLWMDIEEVLFMNKLNQISELSMSEE